MMAGDLFLQFQKYNGLISKLVDISDESSIYIELRCLKISCMHLKFKHYAFWESASKLTAIIYDKP